jgi:hypothetical protein
MLYNLKANGKNNLSYRSELRYKRRSYSSDDSDEEIPVIEQILPIETPYIQPVETPYIQPVETPYIQPVETPFRPDENPYIQPVELPSETILTPIISTLGRTFAPTITPTFAPTNTPTFSPTNTQTTPPSTFTPINTQTTPPSTFTPTNTQATPSLPIISTEPFYEAHKIPILVLLVALIIGIILYFVFKNKNSTPTVNNIMAAFGRIL